MLTPRIWRQILCALYFFFPSRRRYTRWPRDWSSDVCSSDLQEKFNQVVRSHQDLAMKDKIYVFSIFRKSDYKNIGYVDISTIMREEFQWGAIGYRLHNQFWKKGYGKEAVSAVLQIAFESLAFHRIEAHINLDNSASIQLAENVGLTFECVREKFIYEFGEWTDNLVYIKNGK